MNKSEIQNPKSKIQRTVVSLVGAGRLGTAVAALLHRKGWRIAAIGSRTRASAQRARRIVGAGRVAGAGEAARAGDVVLLGVPDDAIATVASGLAREGAFRRGAVVIHFSGALPASILAPARRAGARVGSIHPLQTIASAAQGVRLLPGSFFAVEGDRAALPVLRRIVRDLGGRSLAVRRLDKTLYHVSAVLASNYVVALLDEAAALWAAMGLTKKQALRALLPLLQGTVRNLDRLGLPAALTGPIARGDADLVRAHLARLRRKAPRLLPLYRAAGLSAVRVGMAKGGLSAPAAARLRRTLGEKGRGLIPEGW